MKWENMTADEFINTAKKDQVCVIPMGVIEKHGSHLPLGTDMIIGTTIAEMASEIEPFIIFPYYYFGQINEARHVPGTIAISPKLQMELLDEVVSEISRNGIKKIVLLESHGGNINFLNYFLQAQLVERRDYVVYKIGVFDIIKKCNEKYPSFTEDDHAAKTETELVRAYHNELVHMNCINPRGKINLHRLDQLEEIMTPVSWYCDHPTHQAGDPSEATIKVGREKYKIAAEYVAKLIKKIKNDSATPMIMKEYFDQCEDLQSM